MSENEKNVNPSKELKDGELEKVAGGTRPGYTPSTHNVYAWAWTVNSKERYLNRT